MSTNARRRTAVHEIGHALIHLHDTPDVDFTVDIAGDDGAHGRFTPAHHHGEYVSHFLQPDELRRIMRVAVAGEAAEYVVFGDADALKVRLDHWTFLTCAAAGEGAVPAAPSRRMVDVTVREFDRRHGEVFNEVRAYLQVHHDALEIVAAHLMTRERLTRDEVREFFRRARAR